MSEWDGTGAASTMEWRRHAVSPPDERWCVKQGATSLLADIWQWPEETADECTSQEVEACFNRLADEWSRNTMHISSASDLTNDKSYREIIDLGWDVVPYLLIDLQRNKRFWFPALAEITHLRPFDKSDMSNPRRMTEAWIRWGRRKGYELD